MNEAKRVKKIASQEPFVKSPPPSASEILDRKAAMDLLRKILGGRADALPVAEALREAERASHPDAGGNAEDFKRVQQARAVLGVK